MSNEDIKSNNLEKAKEPEIKEKADKPESANNGNVKSAIIGGTVGAFGRDVYKHTLMKPFDHWMEHKDTKPFHEIFGIGNRDAAKTVMRSIFSGTKIALLRYGVLAVIGVSGAHLVSLADTKFKIRHARWNEKVSSLGGYGNLPAHFKVHAAKTLFPAKTVGGDVNGINEVEAVMARCPSDWHM